MFPLCQRFVTYNECKVVSVPTSCLLNRLVSIMLDLVDKALLFLLFALISQEDALMKVKCTLPCREALAGKWTIQYNFCYIYWKWLSEVEMYYKMVT